MLMFTGIVQGTAEIIDVLDADGLRSLTMRFPPGRLAAVERGASISLDGVCLTVVSFEGDVARFDVIDETLRLTTLGERQLGERLNFERAATFGAEIGGHLLSGHIIGTATVTACVETDGNLAVTLRPPAAAARFILAKGYVALDGISLTIGTVDERDGAFSVHLIPETRAVTTIGERRPGDRINLEVDSMTQAVITTVERLLAAREDTP
ncbi:MAG: riboflavin synthase [Myxococcota bacterium]|jgi:riboflavin synthase